MKRLEINVDWSCAVAAAAVSFKPIERYLGTLAQT